jgi:hypothetical protein
VAFAFALQAGETKDSKDKTATAKVSTTAKAECTDAKKDCSACSSCCKAEVKKQQVLLSPKAAAEKRT